MLASFHEKLLGKVVNFSTLDTSCSLSLFKEGVIIAVWVGPSMSGVTHGLPNELFFAIYCKDDGIHQISARQVKVLSVSVQL